jgi:hypothetical protein
VPRGLIGLVQQAGLEQPPQATEHDDGRLVQPDLERLDAGVDPPQGLLNSLQTPESSARRCETPPSR